MSDSPQNVKKCATYLLVEEVKGDGVGVGKDFMCVSEKPLAEDYVATSTVLARILLHIDLVRKLLLFQLAICIAQCTHKYSISQGDSQARVLHTHVQQYCNADIWFIAVGMSICVQGQQYLLHTLFNIAICHLSGSLIILTLAIAR